MNIGEKLNLVALSPHANYTDRTTAACRRSQCQLLRIDGVTWSAQWIPTAVNMGFQDRSRYLSIQVAPQPHEAEWTPFQTHYFSENLVAQGIEPGPSGSVARHSDH
jgi:hypothetical protein